MAEVCYFIKVISSPHSLLRLHLLSAKMFSPKVGVTHLGAEILVAESKRKKFW